MLNAVVRVRLDEVRVAARDDVPSPRVCSKIIAVRQQGWEESGMGVQFLVSAIERTDHVITSATSRPLQFLQYLCDLARG